MGNGVDILGIKTVKKFNINEVHQVIDVLGLKGDAVDNIPGVPGIGTASKLLKEYGSLEGIVSNQHLLTGHVKKKIEQFGEQGLSKELATIKLDCPITFDEEALRYSGPIEDLIVPVLEELELHISKRIFGISAAEKSVKSNGPLWGQHIKC